MANKAFLLLIRDKHYLNIAFHMASLHPFLRLLSTCYLSFACLKG